jgi:hypothetical protein
VGIGQYQIVVSLINFCRNQLNTNKKPKLSFMIKHYTRTILLGFCLIASVIANTQVQESWTAGLGFIYASPQNACLVVDANENIYTGIHTYDFGEGIGLERTIMIQKFNSSGTEIFSILEPVESFNRTLVDMAVDASGNVYCAVLISVSLDPSVGRSGGMFAVYKYSSSGAVVWKRTYGEGEYSSPSALSLDAAGNVYVTGGCKESGLPGPEYNLFDYLTVKWNSAGTLQWARRYDGASPGDGFNFASDIVVDGSGNAYITGASQKDGLINYATLKYDASGNEKWVQRYNGLSSGDDRASSIAIDLSGFVYVTGRSEGSIATVKYNNDGAQLWVSRKGSGSGVGRTVKVDAFGAVYVAGNTTATQMGVVKYRFDGVEMWAATRENAEAHSMALDAHGNVYVSGTANGDGLIIKYNTQGVSQWFKTHDSPLLDGMDFPVAVSGNENVYVESFISTSRDGNAQARYTASLVKYTQCQIVCPANITVNADPGKCDAVVNFADVTITGDCGGTLTYSHASGATFPLGTTTVTVTSDATGVSCSFTIRVNDNSAPTISCPPNKIVNTDAGFCYASSGSVNAGIASASDNCNPVGVTGVRSDGASLGANYPVGVTTIVWTAKDPSNNITTCSQTITVADNEPPTVLTKNITVNLDNTGAVSITASEIDNGSTDACGIKSRSLSKTNFDCSNVGANSVTLTVTDNNNNTSASTAIVTVVDNISPVISNASLSTQVLAPPNLKMRTVTVNYELWDNCPGATSVLTVTCDEPESGLNGGDPSPDWVVVDNHTVQLRAQRDPKGDGRIYTITITATDASGNITTSAHTVVVAHNIGGPNSGTAFRVGSTVNFSGSFWDIAGNKHTAKWIIDDKITVAGIVTEPTGSKNGTVTGSYKFTVPGVYKLKMNITDQKGITTSTNTNGELDAIVVIYDPSGGYTYGGGSFISPKGALVSNASATAEASYGFTVNYYKNATLPKGETQFEFKVGEFEFNALNFDFLVISNSMAQFKGTGKIIGGQSGIGFTMTVIDGQLDGTDVDKIRLKIYNKNNGRVLYDNQPGASDAALPVQPVRQNSVIVISGTNSNTTTTNATHKSEIEVATEEKPRSLDVIAYPNPTTYNFSVTIHTDTKEKIMMQVTDIYGRIIERRNVSANSIVRFGDRYTPGIYFVRIIQGKEQKEIKLIKLSD